MPPRKKNKIGRPSTFTAKTVNEICQRLSKGEGLAVICRDDKMPGVQTVYDWAFKYEDFSVAIVRARDQGFDAIAQKALEIADERGEDPQSRRVMVDTRLKLLAKWCPKRYGDKIEVEQTGQQIVTVVIGGE